MVEPYNEVPQSSKKNTMARINFSDTMMSETKVPKRTGCMIPLIPRSKTSKTN